MRINLNDHIHTLWHGREDGRGMKLTKDRFFTWEDKDDKDYQKEYDDELIIKVYPYESSKDVADYILSLQDDLDRLLIKHDEVREELENLKIKLEDKE